MTAAVCSEMADGPGEIVNRQFIISAKSQKLTVRTGQPPEAASNLGVLASTCHSLQIGWDPPRERGVEVKCMYDRSLVSRVYYMVHTYSQINS